MKILDLKNRFNFKERLSSGISGLKERLNFFQTLKLLKCLDLPLLNKKGLKVKGQPEENSLFACHLLV